MTGDKISVSASVTTWSGAVMSGAGALSLTDWLAFGGFALAVFGFAVNYLHKRSIRVQDKVYKEEIIAIEREKLEREFPRGD